MTERWRKRLGDLDKQNPSEDLFERAKGGPQLPEEPIARPSTGPRIVTGVAAFLVFALAISVFAIPALRLKGESTGFGGSAKQLPLWPAQTADQVTALQVHEDKLGGSGTFLRDPQMVAQAFGSQVMDWGAFQVNEIPSSGTAHGGPSSGFLCDGAGAFSCDPHVRFGYPPGTSSGPSSAVRSPFRAFQLTRSVCGSDACAAWIEYVFEFQPDRQGPGGVWMVLRAQAEGVTLAHQPGDLLSDGGTIESFGHVSGGGSILGYQAGTGTCETSAATTGFAQTSTPGPGPSGSDSSDLIHGALHAELPVTLPPIAGCAGTQPGYLYAASFERGAAGDPIAGVAATVNQLTAIPVTFDWPAGRAGETESPSASSTPISWTTYSDALGWTIDVPTDWITQTIDGSDAQRTYAGAIFASGQIQQFPGGPTTVGVGPGEVLLMLSHAEGGKEQAPADDYQLPLSYGDMDPVDGGRLLRFRADGTTFMLVVRFGDGAPSTVQQALLERVVSSISFPHLNTGDSRNGWTAVGRVLPYASAEWVTFQDEHWYATYGVDGHRTFIGPAPSCASGGSYEVSESGVVRIRCPDGSVGAWDFQGHAQQGNPSGFAVALNGYAAVLAWDGALLVQLPSSS